MQVLILTTLTLTPEYNFIFFFICNLGIFNSDIFWVTYSSADVHRLLNRSIIDFYRYLFDVYNTGLYRAIPNKYGNVRLRY